jgi:Tol biopolymer transport system component
MTEPDAPDPDVQAALDALSDDGAFDWDAAAAASAEPATRATLDKLRLLAAVAQACRDADDAGDGTLPEPPFRWGPLEVVGRIGRGASGDVFRARDPRLDRLVALKLLPVDADAGHLTAAGMVREGRMLARVHHPHVVSVHGAEHADGHVGIWMELVEGRTLDRIVREDGPLESAAVLAIARDLCDALAAVHDAGLVHGDVKAQNIVRTPAGRVVLMDFGAGRDTQHGTAAPLTGTPLYMAPEVLAGGPVSVRSDVYALGVLLHYLLTGNYPVTAGSMRELARARSHTRTFNHGVLTPKAFGRVIDRALEVDQARRFGDTREMARALDVARPTTRFSVPLLAAASAMVVVAGVLASVGWLVLERRSVPPTKETAALPTPTLRRVTLPDVMLMGRPAPDGRWVAVTNLQGNLARLSLDDGRLQPLTTDASLADDSRFAEFASVSPDGRSVAYGWASVERPYEIRVVDLDGTPPRTVMRAGDVAGAMPLDWWPDRQSLLLTLQYKDGSTSVARLFLAEQRLVRLASVPGIPPEHASLSPDGRWIAYDAAERGTAGHRDIHVVRADGQADQVLAPHPANDFAPLWSIDGRRLMFLSDRSGALDLWSVAVDGPSVRGVPEVLMRNVGRIRLLGLTSRGTLLHQRLTGAADIYLSDLSAAAPTPLADTFVGTNLSPRWSPDGSRIAYASRRGVQGLQGGTSVLVVRDVSTGARREWTPAVRAFTVADWSADGRRVLLFGFDESLQLGNHVFDLTTGQSTAALPGRTAGSGQFTRSGDMLYVDGTKRSVILRHARTADETVLLDFGAAKIEGIVGGAQARGFALSPDERLLAYSGSMLEDGRRVIVLRVLNRHTGQTRELGRVVSPEVMLLHDWSPDGTELLVTRRMTAPPQPPVLWRMRVDGGPSVKVALDLRAVREVSAHPDGRRIAFTAGLATFDVWALDHVVPR